MNFLGHALLVRNADDDVLLGALIADGIKGEPDGALWSTAVCRGIKHHRQLDAAIDTHPETRALLSRMPQRRFAGIALDMFWDHCLSRQHAIRHNPSTQAIMERSYRLVLSRPLPSTKARLLREMANQRWLERYAELSFTCSAIRGLGKRFRTPQDLTPVGEWLKHQQAELHDIFFSRLWPELQQRFAL